MNIKWKKIFDWKITDVSQVLPVKDSFGSISGYKVVVSYLHHGQREIYFNAFQENLYSQYQGPKDAANKVREMYLRQMKANVAHVK